MLCFFEEIEDEKGNIVTVTVPVSDQNQICQSLSQLLGKEIRVEDKTNARRIYSLVKQGGGIGGGMNGEAGVGDGRWKFCRIDGGSTEIYRDGLCVGRKLPGDRI